MELRQYFSVVWKWWWLVLLSVLIAAGSSYYASSRATPLYRTKTTLMVGKVIQNPDPSSQELYTGQQLANTYIQMAKREPVLKAAVETLGWDIDWRQITGKITANVVPQTQLIEIYATDSDPNVAKVLADTVALQLILLSPSGGNQVNQEQTAFIQAQLSDLTQKISTAQEEVKQLKVELDAANSARQIQDLQNQIGIQETKISDWQSTYAELIKSVEGGDVNALNILEEATIPSAPFSPNVRMNVLLAAVIGLVLSVGGIFLIEYLDDTVRVLEDTQRLLNLPTLAKIGRIEGNKNSSKLIALDSPLSPVVDSFRMLRMNLQSISNWQPLRTILFTSVEPAVGKSITVSNLAIVMAQFGNQVILVEADLRKPALNKLFGVPNDIGLKDLLINPDLKVSACLKATKIKNLKLLSCGLGNFNSVEALGSERMRNIVKELSLSADVVLFDSPPALMFSDPYLVGKLVNGVIIVSRVGMTRTEPLKRVVSDMRMAGINVAGVVIQHRKSSEIYGYRYYHRYYEQDGETKKTNQISLVQMGNEGLTVELRKEEQQEPQSKNDAQS